MQDGTDYQLGFITRQAETLSNGLHTYAITIFPNRSSGSVHGPVLWILNDNNEYITGPKAGFQALSHWEGLSSKPNEYGVSQINSWGLSDAAQALINKGLFQIDKNRPLESSHRIPSSYFVVEADKDSWNA
jgi:hypothetical protein